MMLQVIVAVICLAASIPAVLRWLRVAQREHYIPDLTSRFAYRWWASSPVNILLALVGCAGIVISARFSVAAFGSAVVAIVGPVGLSLRGVSSPLIWTRRLKTLAAVSVSIEAIIIIVGILLGHGSTAGAVIDIGSCAIVDLGSYILAPLEDRLSNVYIRDAKDRLAKVSPTVIAITGSYGKTSTKLYTAHLLSGYFRTQASPASFNNRAGLSRAINEQLLDSTEIFVAEMGTYGQGEIRDMCSWMRPEISAITAIGPVHLERMKSEERILQAKSEITETASTVVLQVDDLRLAGLANYLGSNGKRVIRCSSKKSYSADGAGSVDSGSLQLSEQRAGEPTNGVADVRAIRDAASGLVSVYIGHELIVSELRLEAHPSNVACAVGLAVAAGCPNEIVAKQLLTLPSSPHRLSKVKEDGHVTILDDTYNSNPAGCMAALRLLEEEKCDGSKVLVTPGMVELGTRSRQENESFARAAAVLADVVLIVGRTNRRYLSNGISQAAKQPKVLFFTRRDQAVNWVRDNLTVEDVVLYENDLPDHYP